MAPFVRALIAPLLAVGVVAIPLAQAVPDWLARLKTWSAAVASHVPGQADLAVVTLSGWTAFELNQTADDFLELRTLLARVSRQPPLPGAVAAAQHRLKHRDYVITDTQLRDLEVFDGRLAWDKNRVLKLAAMLHADVAILAPVDHSTLSRANDVTRSEDGTVTGYLGLSEHWVVGRQFLDAVVPKPSAESFVRLWYHATSAWMFEQADLADAAEHVAHAVEVLPDGANAHYEAGFFHQAMAAPITQAVVRAQQRADARTRTRRMPGMDADDHLKAAVQMFRRAVRLEPGHAEAQIRQGYALIELGETAEAATHLRMAVAIAQDPALLYLGLQAQGRAEAQLGRRPEAIQCWQRAALLFPEAQSPNVALAWLQSQRGTRADAMQSIGRALDAPATRSVSPDPWRRFYRWQLRDSTALLAELRDLARAEQAP